MTCVCVYVHYDCELWLCVCVCKVDLLECITVCLFACFIITCVGACTVCGVRLCTAHQIYCCRTLLCLTAGTLLMALTYQTALVLLGLFERYMNVKHQTTHVFMTAATFKTSEMLSVWHWHWHCAMLKSSLLLVRLLLNGCQLWDEVAQWQRLQNLCSKKERVWKDLRCVCQLDICEIM